MPSKLYRMPANRTSQGGHMKTVLGSRAKKGFLNVLIPILIGMAIGTFATFILKFMGEGLNF